MTPARARVSIFLGDLSFHLICYARVGICRNPWMLPDSGRGRPKQDGQKICKGACRVIPNLSRRDVGTNVTLRGCIAGMNSEPLIFHPAMTEHAV